jgi:xylulose-5-phosphate/fructose-6-phosphate phosphoketolase
MHQVADKPLMPNEVAALDTHWPAANYLSVGQIYLLSNALLAEPLRASTSSHACWGIGAPRRV